MPCPLCLLGFPEPHTKEDWEKLKDPALLEKLRQIIKDQGPMGPSV